MITVYRARLSNEDGRAYSSERYFNEHSKALESIYEAKWVGDITPVYIDTEDPKVLWFGHVQSVSWFDSPQKKAKDLAEQEQLKKLRNAALAKLSPQEIKLLGLE